MTVPLFFMVATFVMYKVTKLSAEKLIKIYLDMKNYMCYNCKCWKMRDF